MSQEEFRFWEERFAGEGYWYGTEPDRLLVASRSRLPASGSALAIADGEGRNGVFLAGCGLDTVSVDFSPSAQAKARALARARGVEIETLSADLLAWDWPEARFDVVAAVFVQFVGAAGRDVIFRGIRRALKPGGLLLLHGYRTEQLGLGTGGPRSLENLYTRDLLEAAFGDFTDLEITERDEEIHEGVGHVGLSALIDLVGRKPM